MRIPAINQRVRAVAVRRQRLAPATNQLAQEVAALQIPAINRRAQAEVAGLQILAINRRVQEEVEDRLVITNE